MPSYTDFDIRMKAYEMADNSKTLMPGLPVLARIDGRSFHTFTKGMKKPFDWKLQDLMIDTTKYLVENTGAKLGYTQSDEITLAWDNHTYATRIIFDARVQKLTSVLAGMASAYFNGNLERVFLSSYQYRYPHFDCRVWNMPSIEEAANCFVWREGDARRNAVSMYAQNTFSHSCLQGKSTTEMIEMLKGEGVDWDKEPNRNKHGSYVFRKTVKLSGYSPEEIESLPPKHRARRFDVIGQRTVYEVVDNLPPLGSVLNKVSVLFSGLEPIVLTKNESEVKSEQESIQNS